MKGGRFNVGDTVFRLNDGVYLECKVTGIDDGHYLIAHGVNNPTVLSVPIEKADARYVTDDQRAMNIMYPGINFKRIVDLLVSLPEPEMRKVAALVDPDHSHVIENGKFVRTFREASHAVPLNMPMTRFDQFPFTVPSLITLEEKLLTIAERTFTRKVRYYLDRDGREYFSLAQGSFGINQGPRKYRFYPFVADGGILVTEITEKIKVIAKRKRKKKRFYLGQKIR